MSYRFDTPEGADICANAINASGYTPIDSDGNPIQADGGVVADAYAWTPSGRPIGWCVRARRYHNSGGGRAIWLPKDMRRYLTRRVHPCALPAELHR